MKYLLFLSVLFYQQVKAQIETGIESKVEIFNQGWKLIGDLNLPVSEKPLPVVLLLNKAAGDRQVYKKLAGSLSKRGIASLRLDLRGHGESINLGRFIPGEVPRSPMIWDAEADVIAAHKFLKDHPRIDSGKVCITGASYSGEEMADAGRQYGYAQAYIALSPGSFSDSSVFGIDKSAVPWLFIVSNNERHLKEITAAVQANSKSVEIVIVPGNAHASNILNQQNSLADRIAIWVETKLK